MPALGTVPTTTGGSGDFLEALSQKLGVLGGGNRSSSQSTAVGGNANVSVNPTIVNSYGGGAQASPYNYAPVSGSPSGSGSSSAAGSETPSWLNTGALRSAPGAQPGAIDPITGQMIGGSDLTLPLLLGGAALLAMMFMGK